MAKAYTLLLLVGIAVEGNAFQESWWRYVGKGECLDEAGSYFNRLGDRNLPPCCFGENNCYDSIHISYHLEGCKGECEHMGEACVGIQFYSNYENTKSSCELLVRDGISKQSAYGLADKNFCTEPKMVNFDFNSIGGVVKSDNYDNGDVVSPLMCWAHQTTCKEAIGA